MWDEARLRRALAPELRPGERLLWCGKPDAKHVAARYLPALGISLIWAVMSVPFIVAREAWVGARDPWSLPAPWSLSGFLVGLFALSLAAMWLAPVAGYLLARRTVYGVTDRRVIRLRSLVLRRVHSYDRRERACIEARYGGLGTGDLVFGTRHVRTGPEGPRLERAIRLYGVRGAYAVRRLLRTGDPRHMGRGTEPEASDAPAGRGIELEAAPAPYGRGTEPEALLGTPAPGFPVQSLAYDVPGVPFLLADPEAGTPGPNP
ncbi:MAG: hypothetical protein HY321_13380 [Armatimonadetes bacterium]|nr:hypothetical protein [Armatimonadota bacterium]